MESYAGYHQSEYEGIPSEIFPGGTPSESTYSSEATIQG